MDKDEAIWQQAGIKELNEYGNFYEIQTFCEMLNKTDEEVLQMNDVYATKHLLAFKKDMNVKKRFYNIKEKQR